MDLIITGGGAFVILWYLFTIVIPDHDEQNSEGNKRSDDPLPMSKPEDFDA